MRSIRAIWLTTGAISAVVVAAVAVVAVLGLSHDVQPTADRRTVLQFNLCGHACNGGSLGVAERLEGSIRQRSPFAVTLNEVCENQYDSLRAGLPAYQGRFDPTGPRCRNGARYGNAILVQAPHVDFVGSWELPNPANDERRRLMCLSTTVSQAPLLICGTHISNELGNIAAQVAAVATILKDVRHGKAMILGGDFNTDPADPGLNPLYSTEYDSGTGEFHEADGGGAGSRSMMDSRVDSDTINESTYGPHKFDYVFFSGGSWDSPSAEVDGSNGLSDHKALWATATLRPQPPA